MDEHNKCLIDRALNNNDLFALQEFISLASRPDIDIAMSFFLDDTLGVGGPAPSKQVFNALVEAGANPNYNLDGMSILMCLSRLGWEDEVINMIGRGASLAMQPGPSNDDSRLSSPFFQAAKYDRSAVMSALVKAGVDPHERDDKDRSALVVAAQNFSLGSVKWFADQGVDLANYFFNDENLSLLVAKALLNSPKIRAPVGEGLLLWLTESGVDPTVKSGPMGSSALSISESFFGEALTKKIIAAQQALSLSLGTRSAAPHRAGHRL